MRKLEGEMEKAAKQIMPLSGKLFGIFIKIVFKFLEVLEQITRRYYKKPKTKYVYIHVHMYVDFLYNTHN